MNNVVEFGDSRPEFRIFVETAGQLDLGNVSRFLQRLDTGARRIAADAGVPAPTIQIVSLTTGSLDAKLKLETLKQAKLGVLISAATLALGVAAYLRQDPPAARASRALIEGDNATIIIVEGGGVQERIRREDLDSADEHRMVAARDIDRYELLTGPQTGFIREFGGEEWVELDSHPGLIIRLRDRREDDSTLLEANAHYTLEGEAHISRERGPSFFDLRWALLLR